MGLIDLRRTQFVCIRCRDSAAPLDDRLGLNEYLSPQAKRLCCLAGGSWSFDKASDHLQEFCGVKVSDECIRKVTEGLAPKLAEFAANRSEPVTEFTQASGDAEFETDAVKVNTLEGWRDAKIGIFAKRPRGETATPAEWATRKLPKPEARFAFAAIEESTDFVKHWRPLAERLGIDPDSQALTVLGDGAEWIWNRAAEAFPQAGGVLDVFHASEKIADTTKLLFGLDESGPQHERGRTLLLSDGYAGVQEWTGEQLSRPDFVDVSGAWAGMLNYLAGHRERLNYVLRLKRGQSIGSGMVEGAAKNMIGRRLKANNARWHASNVNRMAQICSALYSGYWDAFWLAA